MDRTLAGPRNAEDPAVVRRQGPVRNEPYAAELLLDEPLPDDFVSEEDDEDEEVDDEELDDELDEEAVDGFDAGELLDEEPRLSLR
jgi:hypothetical protein